MKALRRILKNDQLVRDLTIDQLEQYMQARLKEESPSKLGQTIAPKTVKEEINLLRNILTVLYSMSSSVKFQWQGSYP